MILIVGLYGEEHVVCVHEDVVADDQLVREPDWAMFMVGNNTRSCSESNKSYVQRVHDFKHEYFMDT